jgi:hypothetical protein
MNDLRRYNDTFGMDSAQFDDILEETDKVQSTTRYKKPVGKYPSVH